MFKFVLENFDKEFEDFGEEEDEEEEEQKQKMTQIRKKKEIVDIVERKKGTKRKRGEVDEDKLRNDVNFYYHITFY